MQLQYRITKPVREVLARWDFLGFDSAIQCAEAILMHDEWPHNWELYEAEAEDIKTVDNWRNAVLLNNSVNGDFNNVLTKQFGL